jgi:glutathione S-transferase
VSVTNTVEQSKQKKPEQTMALKLFELVGAESNRPFSPYCWRIRMALAHKGLEADLVPWRFLEKAAIDPSGQGKVPVLVHDGKWVSESWEIAQYLEAQFPDRPSLFGAPQGQALSRVYSNLGDVHAGQIVRFVLMDIYNHLDSANQAYFRESREARFGMALEQVGLDRDAKLQGFRDSLGPLRNVLKVQPFFGGETPLYADYAIFGQFQWARAISDFELLAADDPVAQWRTRLLNAFSGMALAAPAYR